MTSTLSLMNYYKIALLRALDIPKSKIIEQVGITEKVYDILLMDENFNKAVSVFKEELNSDLYNALYKDKSSLDFVIKKKMVNLILIAEKEADFLRSYIMEHTNDFNAKELSMLISTLTKITNLLRNLLRDLSTVTNEKGKQKKEEISNIVRNLKESESNEK
ncbi:MAG: hypothetical protein ACTSVB_05580 [Candidatus Heimdallarchaeaceae archaeon]